MVWGAISGFLLSQVFGALWYSKFLFGKIWMKSTFPGKSAEEISKGFAATYTFVLISQATLSLLMQFTFINFLKVVSMAVAIKSALGLGALLTLVNISHLCFSKRPVVAFFIDRIFDTGLLVINAACIFYFR